MHFGTFDAGGAGATHLIRFADVLGLPTIWIPHSYLGCNQHAPDEHVLKSVCREAMQVMAGLFWDIGTRAPDRATS